MDSNAIIQLIGSLGFPIVACIYMFKLLEKSEESHKTEIDSLKESLNNNTNVLTELKTMFSMLLNQKNSGGDKTE